MTLDNFVPEPFGATPLSPDDYEDLIPMWISNRADLNQAEASNISIAQDLYFARALSLDTLLDDVFVRKLHFNMFSDVWRWAGKYRTRELSIGVPPSQVAPDIKNLMEDSKYWLATESSQQLDEAISQIHHKLVSVHPFINGNGRLCRMFADLLLVSVGRPLFTWGRTKSGNYTEIRDNYISSLTAADRGDYSRLYAFVRSVEN